MKSLIVLALLGLVVTTTATGLWFNPEAAQFKQKDEDWYDLAVPVEGGSGEVELDFEDLPAGWDISDPSNSVLIPRDVDRSKRYQLKVVAYDIEYRVSIQRYLIIEFVNGDVNVFVREEFDLSYNLEYYYQIQDREIYEYPSWKKINILIREGDITQLKGIIMKTIDSDNDCDDKRKFLNALLNRIDRFLRDNNDDINEARQKIKNFQKDIKELQERLKELQKERKEDSAEDIRKQLKAVQNKIVWLEKRIAGNQKKIAQYQKNVKDFNKQIWEIKDKKIPNLRKDIKELQAKLKEVQWKIKEGKGDIRWFKKQRDQLKDKISRKEKQIRELQNDIKGFEKKIKWWNNQINKLQTTIKNDRNDLQKFKKQEASLKAELKDTRPESQISKQIRSVQNQIKTLQSRIKQEQATINTIEKSTRKLRNNVKGFRKTIEQSYLECRDFQGGVVDFDDGFLTTTFDRRNFESYFEQNFGSSFGYGSNLGPNVRIVQVNLFSEVWKQTYGAPANFDGAHGCQISGGARRSRITKITKNSIYVSEEGRNYEVRVGDCSILESATGRRLPQVGDELVWQGKQLKDNTYGLAKGICY